MTFFFAVRDRLDRNGLVIERAELVIFYCQTSVAGSMPTAENVPAGGGSHSIDVVFLHRLRRPNGRPAGRPSGFRIGSRSVQCQKRLCSPQRSPNGGDGC